MAEAKKPRVLFAVGDADWKYTRGKFEKLVSRVAAEERFDIYVVTHDPEICDAFNLPNVEAICLPGTPMPLAPEHNVSMTELMIKLTRDVMFPDSRLHLWKVIAMDDYLGSVQVVSHPELPIRPDLLVCPMMGVDNNSSATAHFYSAMFLQARKAGMPIVGLEISLLGNKQTLAASLADAYAVKTEFSGSFLVSEELGIAERVSVLTPEEAYLLTCRNDVHLDDFFEQEKSLRERLSIASGRPVVFIPHHVAFVYEVRELLRGLRALPFPVSVIVRTDPNIARQGLKERDIAERVYCDELAALPHAVVDDQGGWLWSLLLADVVLAPAHTVFTELASTYGKLTVVCQGWGETAWVNDHLYIEPHPVRAVHAVQSWLEHQAIRRKSLGQIISAEVSRHASGISIGGVYES